MNIESLTLGQESLQVSAIHLPTNLNGAEKNKWGQININLVVL
jgi:hypothetical protein